MNDEVMKMVKKRQNVSLYFTIVAHTKKDAVEIITKKDDVFVAFKTHKVSRKKKEQLMPYISECYTAHMRRIT